MPPRSGQNASTSNRIARPRSEQISNTKVSGGSKSCNVRVFQRTALMFAVKHERVIRLPASNRSSFVWRCPRQEAGPKDAGLTSSHARVGYRITEVSSRGCLALEASVGRYDRLITVTRVPHLGPASNLGRLKDAVFFVLPMRVCRCVWRLRRSRLDLACDRPDEADHLPRDSGRNDNPCLAPGNQAAIPRAET